MKPLTTSQNLTAGDLMHPATASVRPTDAIEVAERVMVGQRLTGLPVVDGGRLVGVISRSDVARVHVLAKRRPTDLNMTMASGFWASSNGWQSWQ